MKHVKLLVALGLMMLACTAAIKRPTAIPRGNYSVLDDYGARFVREQMSKYKVTGVSIAVVDDQQVVWSKGFGYADRKARAPVTPQTLFRVGSISKLFNALAVMKLQEAGKLNIDQPLRTYLPEFSIRSHFDNAAPFTLRTMLTHHSGLPSDLLQGFSPAKDTVPFERNILRLRDEYLAYPPNHIWSYSNLAVSLLGCVVERVSGQAYVSFTDEQVLKPLGMTGSSFALRPEMAPLLSKCYDRGRETLDMNIRDKPAGNLYSSVDDLSRFMMMLFNDGKCGDRQFIAPGTLAEMQTAQNANVPRDGSFRIGLGFFLTYVDADFSYAGGVAEHGGDTKYFHCELVTLPKQKLGIVVLTNSAGGTTASRKIATELLKVAVEAKTGLQAPDPAPFVAAPAALDTVRAKEIAGTYGTMVGPLIVKRRGSNLRVTAQGLDLALKPWADSSFEMELRLLDFIPIRVPGLDRQRLFFRQIGDEMTIFARMPAMDLGIGSRMPPFELSETWKKRAGRYDVLNGGDDQMRLTRIDLSLRKGSLQATALLDNEKMEVLLYPRSDSECVSYGLGRNMMETFRIVERDGHERLLYSGYELEKRK